MSNITIKKSSLVIFLLAFLLCFSGYFEIEAQEDYARSIRSIIVLLFFISSFFLFFLSLRRKGEINLILLFFLIVVFYSFLNSLVQRGGVEPFGYFFKLATVFFVSSYVCNALKVNEKKMYEWIESFIGIVALFFIFQLFLDVVLDRSIFLNGSDRYFASVGSPIGYAAALFSLLVGVLYLWLRGRKKYHFFIALTLVWSIFMTGTRSISVFSLFVLFWALFVRWKWKAVIILSIISLLTLFLFIFFDISIPALGRVQNTIETLGRDGSTMFRVFILDTVRANLTWKDLLFGLGLGGFPIWFQSNTGIENVAPHFEWLWWVVEFGLFGIILLLLVFLLLFYLALKTKLNANYKFLVLNVVLIPLVYLQLANPFYFFQFYIPFSVTFGLVLSGFMNSEIRYTVE